jgi:hypothetical protein
VVAVTGTVAVIEVSLQLPIDAAAPLKVTLPAPCVTPKWLPAIVTEVPMIPKPGVRPVICGVMVNVTPLLRFPPAVTTTGPVVAVAGIGTTILVALQLVGVAVTPLNVTILVP